MQQPQAGLEIKASYSIWYFMLALFPPKISVNGSAPIQGKWGDNLIPMTPGRHTVQFWWPMYWFIPANKSTLVVDIGEGQVAQLEYKPRWFWFLEGRMAQTGVRPINVAAGAAAALPQSAAQPAGWHPDPSGRHELRYWNGSSWTDDVSDGGVATKDTITA